MRSDFGCRVFLQDTAVEAMKGNALLETSRQDSLPSTKDIAQAVALRNLRNSTATLTQLQKRV